LEFTFEKILDYSWTWN